MERPRTTKCDGHIIVTNYWLKPVASRGNDWEAYLDSYDGAPDTKGDNSKVGYGLTEAGAIQDLLDQLED